MNQQLIQRVYDNLKTYVEQHSNDAPVIMKKYDGISDPAVVIQCISNIAIATQDPHSQLIFGIDIYTKNKEINGVMKLDVEISEALEALIDQYMSNHLGFRRTMDGPVKEDDVTIYHRSMQYTTTISDQRCHFF